jgi:hypothetical protein
VADQTSDQAAQARAQEAQKAAQARAENAKKVIAEQRQAREQRMADMPDAGKPTPTQEENDLAAMGVHLPEHEPDGSPEQDPNTLHPDPLRQPHQNQHQTRQSEARRPQGGGQYQTRSTQAKSADAE